MRKLLAALAIAAAFTGVIGGTAAADTQRADGQAVVAAGIVGYYKTKGDCLAGRAAYDIFYTVGPCFKNIKGWYFKFS